MTNSDDRPNDRAARIADSIQEQEQSQDDGQPRREFLSNSAIAGGALLALGGSAGLAIADQHEGEDEDENGMPTDEAAFDDVEGTDIDVLNYALTLEHLEAAFYREATEQFSEDDFMNAESLSQFNEEMRTTAWEYVQVVGEHEATHVEVLTQAVTLLGGEPVEEGDYDFGVESVGDFLMLASILENTGVAAYAGAAPFVQSPDLLASALSIHSVEARHAAVFNVLTGQSPSPNAFDEAATQQEVLDAVGQFIVDSEEPTDGTETPDETEPGNGTDTATEMPNGTDTATEMPNGTDTATEMPNGTETTTEMPNGTGTGTSTDTPGGQ